jgi:hypothetical protein
VTETTMPEFETVDDLMADAAENAGYHTILEVWREVLAPAKDEAKKKITPQWANRIVTTYSSMFFGDMGDFRDRYFGKIADLEDILLDEIHSDDECLNMTTPEEDAKENAFHYLNVLINWQKAFLSWELDWDFAAHDAHAELAAISEVHRMFFDPNGLTALLDQIKFEFTDNDRDLLAAELEDLRASKEG